MSRMDGKKTHTHTRRSRQGTPGAELDGFLKKNLNAPRPSGHPLKDDFQAFGATGGSTVDNRLTFRVNRAVWTLAAKMDDGAPWHKGVLQGAEKFMTSWHKEEEEASRRRVTKRDFRDLEPPTHL